jgi:hypothetical protein
MLLGFMVPKQKGFLLVFPKYNKFAPKLDYYQTGKLLSASECLLYEQHLIPIPIIKDFMLAQQGVNYGVKLFWFEDVARIEACTLDNGQTNERLVIKGTRADLSISRYPIGSNEEWIEEMTGWGCNGFNKLFSEYRNIFINF